MQPSELEVDKGNSTKLTCKENEESHQVVGTPPNEPGKPVQNDNIFTITLDEFKNQEECEIQKQQSLGDTKEL
tara:strand:- start:40 stop:258 length:219 start_codon:yes stop_codon:yes gene_type:complete